MGHYRDYYDAEREQQRYERKIQLEGALSDLQEGNKALHVSREDRERRSRVARAKDLITSGIDLLRLEIGELNDGFLKE